MSKKMLKRSLALGALMAFVITGSALAEDITTQEDLDSIINDKETVNYQGAIIADDKTFNINTGVLNLESSTTDGYYGEAIGVYTNYDNSKISVGMMAKELNVISNCAAGYAGIVFGGHGAGQEITFDIGSKENNIENITVTTPNGYGIYLNGRSGAKHTMNVFADNIVIKSKYGALRGYHADSGSTINLGSADNPINKVILTGGAYEGKAFAIYSHTTSGINIYGNDVEISGSEGSLKATFGNIDIAGYEKLDIKGDILISNTGREDRGVTINKGINNALVTINGNISTSQADFVNVTLGKEGSYIKGSITDNSEKSVLSMNPGTIWNVTGASTLNKLQSNNGYISFASDSAVEASIQNASGSVLLTETGKTADDYNTSEQLSKIANKLDVSKDASESLEAKVIMPAGVVRGVTTGVVTYADTDGDNLFNGTVAKEDISESVNTTNSGIAEMHSIALMAWRAENNDMHKRLGELRDANGEHGAWARMTRGESEYESVKNQYNAYQLGYDQKAGDWTVGAAVTYTEGETSFAEGNGENDHTGLAVYGSKLNGDGSYLDLIAKYAKLDHEYTVSGGIGSGEYDTDGFALSAEYGKRFEQGNGLWIEPQVELTYGLVDSVGFAAENGRVSLDDMNSLVGRVGFRAGKDVKDGNVYVRASYLYDFEGETDIAFTDGVDTRSFKQDLGGGWWEFGIGTNINLSKATYIYADVEHACGGEVDTDWKWNLGVRYSF